MVDEALEVVEGEITGLDVDVVDVLKTVVELVVEATEVVEVLTVVEVVVGTVVYRRKLARAKVLK